MKLRSLRSALLLLVSLSSVLNPLVSAAAQAVGVRDVELAYPVDTGPATHAEDFDRPVHSFTVHVEGASSLRLFFAEVDLGGGWLLLTAHKDGAVQRLDARSLRQWQRSSAYFNGDRVQVELVQPAHAQPGRLVLESVTAQLLQTDMEESQCGSSDDRVATFDGRDARVLPIGCSSFMVDDCNHCFFTAGHCLPGASVVQFDVPNSLSNGNIVHPGPDKQYAVDQQSVQGIDGPVGDDWGYFGVFPNSNTDLSPGVAQGNWYGLADEIPPFQPGAQLRVTGFGADSTPPENNQIQQSSFGPWTGVINFWELYYEADTTAGSSGSPVLLAGLVIGIHTNGGCDNSLGNSGTGITRPALADALANPMGVCAGSCSGLLNTYCEGKLNSQGCLPSISSVGTPTLSGGPGSFTLEADLTINQKPGLLFYGLAPSAVNFLGGTLCVNPPLRRTPLLFSGGNSGPLDCSGVLTFDFGAWAASGTDPFLNAGETVHAQFNYRDPASQVVAPTGLSNAIVFELLP